MSGLEALAVLGLACNIFQVISFGRETLTLIKGVYHNGTIDDALMDKSIVMQAVATEIMAVEIPRPLGKHEQKLFDVMKKCSKVASDLQEEIALIEVVGHNAKGNLGKTLRTGLKMSWRRRQLQKIEKDLTSSEQMMQSTLLVWIIKLVNARKINTDSLEENLRDFKIKYENGCRHASELVSQEALKVREAIARESRKTEKTIQDHITRTSAKVEQRLEQHLDQATKDALQKKLLGSFKYPSMNERANQIEVAHARTFQWLFGEEDGSSDGYVKGMHQGKRPEIIWDSFTDWLQSDHNFYWIMGKPGSGKSSLTKFILSNPRTKIELGKWRRDVTVASHCFWRPGHVMQRSIKGMLCSLAHQLVFSIPNALQYALLNVHDLDQKDADTDWAVLDLQRLCLGLIGHFGRPVCLLIDGLDECGPEDDHQELLKILESFKLKNVKIIASSRNEPVFERRFRNEPQLRIQDLTFGDLSAYATDKLHHEIRRDGFFVSDLARKAEGVFLWLVLAVQGLNRGFSNGDSVPDLRKRMETLPKRLNDLYKDMWRRLNDDTDIYKKDAALYFRLVIAQAACGERRQCMRGGFSVMEMMLALSETSRGTFSESCDVVSTSQLLHQCGSFRENVEVRCAGLLSAPRDSRNKELPRTELEDAERALLGYARRSMGFQFIHRSARDFLLDTTDGRKILLYEGTSSECWDSRLVSACLRSSELLHPIMRKGRSRNDDPFKYAQDCVQHYLHDLSSLAEVGDSAVEALFSRCFELYSSSILLLPQGVYHGSVHPARIAAFFGVAVQHPNLDRYSINLIEKRLLGREIRSAIFLAIFAIGPGRASTHSSQAPLPSTRAPWLSLLREVEINLKSPLVAFRSPPTFATGSAAYTPNARGMGPLDHIKASPFTSLLGYGLVNLDWKSIKPHMTQLLQLVCDFVSRRGNIRSTVFLACPDRWHPNGSLERHARDAPRVIKIPGWDFFDGKLSEDDERVICVVALEAITVIRRMLATLLETDHGSSKVNGHSCRNASKSIRSSDLEAAVSFLSQRCQQDDHKAEGRVVGLLQPCGNFADMPYRQVTDQDSAHLITKIWPCMDVTKRGLRWDRWVTQLKEVVARSPFSSIGFRDYLRDRGYFDELAAHTMLVEFEQERRAWDIK